jgi:ribosomal protein S24E
VFFSHLVQKRVFSKPSVQVDAKNVFCFGFKLAFGGGRSTGFALIYDSLEAALDVEPKYRLIRVSVI